MSDPCELQDLEQLAAELSLSPAAARAVLAKAGALPVAERDTENLYDRLAVAQVKHELNQAAKRELNKENWMKKHPVKQLARARRALAMAVVASLSATTYGQTLSNGSLSVLIRSDNGAIDAALFSGIDFFNPGTPVSDWGLQAGTNTSTFRLNTTGGVTGIPVSVSGGGSTATVSGTYTLGGSNLAFTRQYQLVTGQNAVRVTTLFENNAESPFTLSYFDTFDPDQGSSASFSTFNDVYSTGSTRLARASASSNGTSSGTPTLSFVAATNDASATLAAGGPFSIGSGDTLNAFFAAPTDGNGTLADQGVHIGLRRTLAPGDSYSFTTVFAFGLTPSAAELAALASLPGGTWNGNADGPSGPSGNWSTGGNWSSGLAPSAIDAVTFSVNQTYTVTINQPATAANVFVTAGNVVFNLNNQTLATGEQAIYGSGNNPTLTILGPGTMTVGGRFDVARASNATLNIDGSNVNVSSNIIIGRVGFTGTARFNNHATVTSGGTLLLGSSADGTSVGNLTVDTGASFTATAAEIGGSVSGNGSLTVDNAQIHITGWMGLAGNDSTAGTGTGTLTVQNNAEVTIDGALRAWTSTSRINLSGGTLRVGSLDLRGTSNRLNWTAGTLELTDSSLIIEAGHPLGASATIGSGKVLKLSDTGERLRIGANGVGSLTISGGGLVEVAGSARLADEDNSTGTVLVTGVGSKLKAAGLVISNDIGATGTLTVQNGGVVEVTNNIDVADAGGITGVGTLNVSGSASKVTGFNMWLGGTPSSDNGAKGTVNLSGGAIEIAATTRVWNNNSQINLLGGTFKTGSLRLDGVASRLNWTSGTLHLDGGTLDAALNIPTTGTLAGTGTITGHVTNAGLISPGTSPGVMHIDGNLSGTGDYLMQIASLAGFDQINVTGALSFTGSTITIALLDGYIPAAGSSFDLFDFTGAIGGTWSFDFSAAALPSNRAWDTSAFATTGAISVIQVPEPKALAVLAPLAAVLLRRRRGVTAR
jgi:T5SS/PEP-CTERM-associated repeat protein